MPARKKRPHPRSLEALFPIPKVSRCPRGHGQTPMWKRHHGCQTCRKDDAQRAEVERMMATNAGAAEREAWRRILGPPPLDMSFRTVREGKLIRYTIPPHLMRKPGSRRARRRI